MVYSSFKIASFPRKLSALHEGEITYPLYVRIKPTNRCSHRCSFCVYADNKGNMHETCNRTDEIETGDLIQYIDDLDNMGTRAVVFSGGGEPLMHPGIEMALDKVLNSGMGLGVLTNGMFLTTEISKYLRDSSWVRLSIDYWDEESFSKSRGVAKKWFGITARNISYLSSVKQKSCSIGANFILTKENYRNIEKACSFLKTIGVEDVRISPVWMKDFHEYHDEIYASYFIKDALSLSDDDFRVYDGYHPDKVLTERPYSKCYFCQICPVIAADYNMYLCHNKAYDKSGLIGNLRDKHVEDLWYSEETKKFMDFDPREKCAGHQCSSESRNLFIHEVLSCWNDPFI